MTPEDVKAQLDLLKQVRADHAESLAKTMESHFDQGDRAIGQLAQLRIINEGSPAAVLQALKEVATSGNPL